MLCKALSKYVILEKYNIVMVHSTSYIVCTCVQIYIKYVINIKS